MIIEEIEYRLERGEKLHCEECDYYNDGNCLIIICENPFLGPLPDEIEDHVLMIEEFYHESKKKG